MRIIVVENEIRIREGICKLITNVGNNHEIVGEASNGREGLQLIMEKQPDLVITDIKMPVMDGLEMLKEMNRKKYTTKAIVISAYSEFSYAQQAIALSVSEYLLKPVTVDHLTNSLRKVEEQYASERFSNPKTLSALENVLNGIIFGGLKIDEDILFCLNDKYQISKQSRFVELIVRISGNFESVIDQVKEDVKSMFYEEEGVSFCILDVSKEKSFLVVFYGLKNESEFGNWIKNKTSGLHQKYLNNHLTFGLVFVDGPGYLKADYLNLFSNMDWGITLGSGAFICYPDVIRIQTVPCSYPINIENELKAALCENNMQRAYQLIDQFIRFFGDKKMYLPKEVKESYVRFTWVIINIAKEIGIIDYQQLEQQKLLEAMMDSQNYSELQDELIRFIKKLNPLKLDDNLVDISPIIMRMKSMIHEFYQTGITLDEIAERLNITPEYLGAMFHKEMGINFSGYIKKCRINKAKELLLGTQLKLYEISEKIGYTDAKYFSRVFKECTGQHPADYRKTH